MGKRYLNAASPPSFKKFSVPSASQKMPHRLHSQNILAQPRQKLSNPAIRRPLSNKLPLRSHVAFKTASDSTPVTRKRTTKGAAPPPNAPQLPAMTGLEETEVLADHSTKRFLDQGTQTDEGSYAKRIKTEHITDSSQSFADTKVQQKLLTDYFEIIARKDPFQQKLLTDYFSIFRTEKQKDAARKLRRDVERMPSSLQRGMTNHTGAVCYRLSLLQSLLHLPVFVNWVLDQVLPATCVADNHEACVSCCLHQLVKQYWAGASTLKNLQILNVLLKQKGWATDVSSGHADPDEQAVKLFKTLREELPTPIYKHVDTIFETKYTSIVQCKCGHKSRTPNHSVSSLSLPMQPKAPGLAQYIEKYMSETISGYKCSSCKQTGDVRRYLEITQFPEVLTVQLKRIDFTGRKNSSQVNIPATLDLTEYSCDELRQGEADSAQYDLVAVIKHSGTGGFGHYICNAIGADRTWLKFDDDRKSKILETEPRMNKDGFTPYMMYYQRKR